MSDLAATNCGCGDDRSCGCGCGCENNNDNGCGIMGGFGSNNCCSILWIIILLCMCGNGNRGCSNWGGGDNCCWIIIVLLLLCCGNNGNDCGCGCRC